MPSLLDSPPQIPAAGAWGSLYAVQEPVKPRHVTVAHAAVVAKKPAYCGIRKKNLEMCTEALGCETGAVDAAPVGNAADKGYAEAEAAECAERKRRAREEEAEEMEERRRRPLPPPLTTLAHGASRVRMVHERPHTSGIFLNRLERSKYLQQVQEILSLVCFKMACGRLSASFIPGFWNRVAGHVPRNCEPGVFLSPTPVLNHEYSIAIW